MKWYFGLNYYNALIECLNFDGEYLDPRMFHVLFDHKIMMKFRIDYLHKNNIIGDLDRQQLIRAVDDLKEDANFKAEINYSIN